MAKRRKAKELATRIAMMPRDTNGQGNIFGGVLLSQIHSAGNIVARNFCRGGGIVDVVSRAMDAVEFKKAVHINDVISCYCTITHVGRTSVTVHVEVEADREGEIIPVTAADVVYVAVDVEGKAVPIPGGKKRRTKRPPGHPLTPCETGAERVLALRQTMMPHETHGRGLKSIFGGALLSHMDLAGSYMAHRVCKNKYIKRCVTRVMNKVEFTKAVFVNDTITCYGTIRRIGKTSITLHIDVEADREGVIIPVTSADMVFVALDENGNPTNVLCSPDQSCTTGGVSPAVVAK